jgi:hypothetical protein
MVLEELRSLHIISLLSPYLWILGTCRESRCDANAEHHISPLGSNRLLDTLPSVDFICVPRLLYHINYWSFGRRKGQATSFETAIKEIRYLALSSDYLSVLGLQIRHPMPAMPSEHRHTNRYASNDAVHRLMHLLGLQAWLKRSAAQREESSNRAKWHYVECLLRSDMYYH